MRKSRRQQLYRIDRFREYYKELFSHSGLGQIAKFTQHGTTSRLLHSVAVAYYSYRLALFTRLQFHLDDLVRGHYSMIIFSTMLKMEILRIRVIGPGIRRLLQKMQAVKCN